VLDALNGEIKRYVMQLDPEGLSNEEEFHRNEADAIRGHLAQLRKSNGRQALPLDLLRSIKRLNNHLVAGAAYSVLEARGALLASRVSDGSS
jgi:phosphate:Na+ symporter